MPPNPPPSPGGILPGDSPSITDPTTGLPNLSALTPATQDNVDKTGMLSIWDIPDDIRGLRVWFDVGHKPQAQTPVDSLLGAATGGAYKAPKEPYRIMRSPVQVMKQFAAMSFNNPDQFFALQRALSFGPWGTVEPSGSFDAQTEHALGNAMQQYLKLSMGAGVGVSFTDYLLQASQRNEKLNPTAGPAGSSGPGPSPTPVTDPTEIRQAVQQAAQAALGQGLNDDQLSKFVAQFQAAQVSAESATRGQVSAPDLGSQAMAFAQQSDPHAYHQNQRQSFLNTLVNMFAPGGSQRPSMTPVPTAGG